MRITNKFLFRTVFCLVAIAALLLFAAFTAASFAPENAHETTRLSDEPVNAEPDVRSYNVLVAGTDKGGGRTDVLMLANIDTGNKTVSVVSIPRDTYVILNGRPAKINACNAKGGMSELRSTVEETFGVKIDRCVIIDLNAFVDIVDAFGGVEVNVARDMHYDDDTQNLHIDIKKGVQLLDGKQAECFVRFRSGYAMADLTRIEAQKIFVAAFMKKALAAETIPKWPSLIKSVGNKLETDLETAEIMSTLKKMIGISLSDIAVYTAPGQAYNLKGVSYYTLYKSETVALMNQRFNTADGEISAKDITLTELGRTVNTEFDYNGTPLSELVGKASPSK